MSGSAFLSFGVLIALVTGVLAAVLCWAAWLDGHEDHGAANKPAH